MTGPGPIGHGTDQPNKLEEYAAAAGVGLLATHWIPGVFGWLGIGVAVVSYIVRYYRRHG